MILNFLAAEGRLSTQHIDCIWAAAQVILTFHIYLTLFKNVLNATIYERKPRYEKDVIGTSGFGLSSCVIV